MCKYKHLPQGWKVKKLEEIKTIEFLRGNGLPKSALNDSGKSECIHYGQLYTTYKHPVIKKVVFRTNIEGKRLSNKGDVLIPGTTTADAMGIAIARSLNVNNVVIGGDINILRTKNMDIFSDFLSYYLNGPAKVELASYANGTNILHLSNKKIKKILIPIPSLSEQKRIVVILDKTFAEITKAEAIAKTNLQNAKELFESYLNNVFENKGDDWENKRLDELTEVKDGTHDSPKYITDGIPFVTQKNIKSDGFNIENTKFITEVDHQKFYQRSNVTYGDILISMIGANRGMSAIVDIKNIFSIKNVGLIKESENINQFFLLNYLHSTFAMKYVKLMSNGGAQEFIGLKALRAFPISFPKSKDEQQQIVKKLNSLSSETKKLEIIYQKKIDNLVELKKSILQKAFNGEL